MSVKGFLAALLILALASACGVPVPPTVPELEERAKGGDAEAAELLVERLGGDATREDRSAAYRALAGLGNKAKAQIIAACTDNDGVKREHALALAGNLKLPEAYNLATTALADAGFTRKHAAVWVLGELSDERALPASAT